MKILLTGGSGFVGRNVRESLSPRHDVFAPGHRELDVTDSAAVDRTIREGRFDAVIHAAVQGGESVLETTLRGYWNLARNASRVGRIIYFGSGAEYGKNRDLKKVCEDRIGEHLPADAYGLAKFTCNMHARAAANIVNLRIFGVYGKYEGYLFRFISNSIVKIMLGLPVDVRQNVVFDYLYIDDLLEILEPFLDGPLPGTDFNVTPDSSISLEEILGEISASLGVPVESRFETEGLNFEYTGCNHRLHEVIPDLAFTPYSRGIARLAEFYTAHAHEIDRTAVVRDEYRSRCRIRTPATDREAQ